MLGRVDSIARVGQVPVADAAGIVPLIADWAFGGATTTIHGGLLFVMLILSAVA